MLPLPPRTHPRSRVARLPQRQIILGFEPHSASLRTILLDDSEHLLHNHQVSVAALRLLFTFAPECRSASHRNERSPSPEYQPRALLLNALEKSGTVKCAKL